MAGEQYTTTMGSDLAQNESARPSSTVVSPAQFKLLDLPTELHLHISSYLSYPDALALKHTCRHFYSLVYTGVHLKVDWLVERFERKLECPMEKCSFRTDEAFCNWRIRRIMERRRRHLECSRNRGGCLVIERQTCQPDSVTTWLKRQGRGRLVKSVGNEVLIHTLIVLCMRLLWDLCTRFLFPQGQGWRAPLGYSIEA